MKETGSVASLPLTVSNGVSQLAHGANRHFTFHAGHAGSTTSFFSSSLSLCLRGQLWRWTSRSLITFQKHIRMALDTLRWGGWEEDGKEKTRTNIDGRGKEMLWSHNNWLASVFKSMLLFRLIRWALAVYRLALRFIKENQRQALSMSTMTEAASGPHEVQSICIGFRGPKKHLALSSCWQVE